MFSFFLQETFKSFFQQPYHSLKPNHDKNYLMNSEDTSEDPLRSVNFNLKSKVYLFRVSIRLLHFKFGDEIVRISDR